MIWQNLEKNATHIMIFLPHYMWAEDNNTLGNIQGKFDIGFLKRCSQEPSVFY